MFLPFTIFPFRMLPFMMKNTRRGTYAFLAVMGALILSSGPLSAGDKYPPQTRGIDPFPLPKDHPTADDLHRQTEDDVHAKSWGCVACHTGVGDMHDTKTVKLGCTDCHGGNADCTVKESAH